MRLPGFAAAGAALAVVLGTVIAAPVPSLAKPAHHRAFVRLNQVGYAIGSPKRAYLLSPVAETGAIFAVRTPAGRTVYSAHVGKDLGAWNRAFSHVYALDFNTLNRHGSYMIAVTGPLGSKSLPFRVDTGASLYATPLANALSFYQNERDGPDFIRSPLRTAPGHLNDGHAMTYLTPKVNGNGDFKGDLTPLGLSMDADGGWWDAGDYLKFVETTSYVVDMMLVGVRDFPHQMGMRAPRASRFVNEATFGLGFLQRMWNDKTRTLYYQVGIGEGNAATIGDHDIWRLPQVDDTYGGHNPLYRYIRHRPVFRAGPPGSLISPNLAGRLAAAFALCYQVDRTIRPAYADRCLKSAEDVFALANTDPTGNLLTAIPYDFYPESEWRDDLELGATELYFALAAGRPPAGLPKSNPLFYLHAAAKWAHAYITGPNDAKDTLNLYDVSGLAHYELYRAISEAHDPRGLAVSKAALLADMAKALNRALGIGATDPFGFGFPWDTWDTTSHGAGLVVMANEYDQLTHSRKYAVDGWRWLANILGANAWGLSFIVGDGNAFPDCLQHQVANLVGSLDGGSPILKGAAVEGPNSFAAKGFVTDMRACPVSGGNPLRKFNSTSEFKDNMQAYSNTEPAIDLTAASPLAFSWASTG